MLSYDSVMHVAKTDIGYRITFRKLSIAGQFALAASASDSMWHHVTENGSAKIRAFKNSKQTIRIAEKLISGEEDIEQFTTALFKCAQEVSDFIKKNPGYGYYSLDGHLACACATLLLVHHAKPELAKRWLGCVRLICDMIGHHPSRSLTAGSISRRITETIGEIDYETDGNV